MRLNIYYRLRRNEYERLRRRKMPSTFAHIQSRKERAGKLNMRGHGRFLYLRRVFI